MPSNHLISSGPAGNVVPHGARGPYTVVRTIGSGGMAKVFLARDANRQLVALKRIEDGLAQPDELQKMVLDEATIANQLTHPNIVKVLDYRADAAACYLIMEYIHGHDLRQIRRRTTQLGESMPQAVALYVLIRVCSALAYAHGRCASDGRNLGIVHRDISPPNVILSNLGEVKLVDFGIAHAAERRTRTKTGHFKGKIAYMSPEQALGRTIDHRSDLFAVGVVAYELLCGHRPFVRETPRLTMEAVCGFEPPPPSALCADIAIGLDQIILRALRKRPAERYGSASEIQHALEQHARQRGFTTSAEEVARWLEQIFPQSSRASHELYEECCGPETTLVVTARPRPDCPHAASMQRDSDSGQTPVSTREAEALSLTVTRPDAGANPSLPIRLSRLQLVLAGLALALTVAGVLLLCLARS